MEILELDAFTVSCYADIIFGWACEHVRDVLHSGVCHGCGCAKYWMCVSGRSHLPDVYRFGRKRLEVLMCRVVEENDNC